MRMFYATVIAAAALVPNLALSDDAIIPYMNPDGPQPREISCRIADHGKVYHNGTCYFQVGLGGSFIVTTGNAKYSATVDPIDGDFGQAMWTEEAFASHMHGQLHDVTRSKDDPACWENDELSICAW